MDVAELKLPSHGYLLTKAVFFMPNILLMGTILQLKRGAEWPGFDTRNLTLC